MAKKIKKIIPKEIKPALPALAAIFGPAALATYGPAAFSGTGVLASLPARAMISSAIAQAATEGKIDPKDTLLAGGQAYLGQKLSAYGQPTLSGAQGPVTAKEQGILKSLASKTGEFLAPSSPQQLMEGRFTSAGDALGLLKTGVKSAIPQASVAYAEKAKELNEKALRDYEAQLREQGIMDSAERRNAIFGYFSRAGYGDDEINSMLDKYGYAYGGRVGYEGGGFADLLEYLKEKEKEDDDEFKIGDLTSAVSGFETAFGKPMMERPQPMGINPGFGNMPRMRLAEGGIPNAMAMRKTIAELIASGVIDEEDVEEAISKIKNQAMMSMRAPGMAEGGIMNLGGREMDMRGGGFIPIGSRERADDVPARLSKNEFVMTADAVRSAGGGSINKGAKRMYDLMNRLEAKA